MTQTYSQRVRDNILPLSVGDTLPKAFEEWSFTDETEDHEEPVETCQLCDQEQLRYHFKIRNAFTHHSLWVGSHCILKFGLSIFERGRKLSPTEAKRKLARLTEKMHQDSCVRALRAVLAEEENAVLKGALDYYEKNKFLTPKQAWVVLWRLKTHGINHNPTFFTVRLKRDQHKYDLRTMAPERVHLIWPALSTAQKRMAVEMGHQPPEQLGPGP